VPLILPHPWRAGIEGRGIISYVFTLPLSLPSREGRIIKVLFSISLCALLL
jgi:hypothetical protein